MNAGHVLIENAYRFDFQIARPTRCKSLTSFLILLQVENKNEIFEARKSKPPLIMNEPPVAGAIRWAQFLFHRLKRTILPFLKVPEMLKCELISAVS